MGATVAAVLSNLPFLVAISRHKAWVFTGSGLLLAATGWYVFRLAPALASRRTACPPEEEARCAAARRVSRVVLLLSPAIYLAGLFAASVLGPILEVLDR